MLIGLVAALAAQVPAAVGPQAPATTVAKKQKPQQVCEMIEVTGSRARQQVCHDVGTRANLEEYGVSDTAFGKSAVHAPAAPSAPQ